MFYSEAVRAAQTTANQRGTTIVVYRLEDSFTEYGVAYSHFLPTNCVRVGDVVWPAVN